MVLLETKTAESWLRKLPTLINTGSCSRQKCLMLLWGITSVVSDNTALLCPKLKVFNEAGLLAHYVDGQTEPQNWMKFVNSARHIEEQNLILLQDGDQLFYESSRDILHGEQLLVWYGSSYDMFMGVPTGIKTLPKKEKMDEAGQSKTLFLDWSVLLEGNFQLSGISIYLSFQFLFNFLVFDCLLLNLLQVFLAASRVKGVVKFLPINTTEIATWSTHVVLIRETESFPVMCVTGLLTSGIAFVSMCYMYTKNTALTSAQCAEKASLSHPALTSTWEYTVERDHTNVPIVSRPLQLLLFYAHTFVNIVGKSPLSVDIVGVHSPPMLPMIVTCVARILKRSRVCVNTVERLLLSLMNWSFTSTCTQEPNPIPARNAGELFLALLRVTVTVLILIALLERIAHQKSCERHY